MRQWATEGPVVSEVVAQVARCLATYREDAKRVEEDAAIESSIAEGGYGRKQLYELIQNGADAMLAEPGEIEVVLTKECLYVANAGRPLTVDGVDALMASHLSRKRGDEIGRFGLGFKSVVAISDRPRIFSRSGSFGFDRELAESTISRVVPDAPAYPLMRVAAPLDPHAEAQSDPVLKELMEWATTVVKVPLRESSELLSEDIAGFPASFLLFSPHARSLRMVDRTTGAEREIRLEQGPGPGELILRDSGQESTRWRVARRVHRPSAEALRDAGRLAHRETIEVSWAVPLSGRDGLGQFWAFFPTQDRTTLSGIVNAPWKLSDDRRNLLPGAFNDEILRVVLPEIVASEWPHLQRTSDPSWPLDLLPARGREVRSWADGRLNEPVYDALRRVPSLPDVTGTLCVPTNLRMHPDGLTPEAMTAWTIAQPPPSGWVHHSADQNSERRSKALRLITGLVGSREGATAELREWVEALVRPDDVHSSAIAIDVLSRLRDHADFEDTARTAKVVLLEDGHLVPARRGQVFVRSSDQEQGYEFIHPQLAAMPGTVRALKSLGIELLDRAGELRNAVSAHQDAARLDWRRIWALSRSCGLETAEGILRQELREPIENSVRVKNRAGAFVPLGRAYLPGAVIRPHSRGDERFEIDLAFHHDDLELLERLGAVSQPVLRRQPPRETWLRAYEERIFTEYLKELGDSRVTADQLVAEGPTPPWPLEMLPDLSPEAKAAVTSLALRLTSGTAWKVRHASSASFPQRSYKDPVLWWVRKHGMLPTELGPFSVGHCVLAGDDVPDSIFPTVELDSQTAEALQVAEDLDHLSATTWGHLFELARTWDSERRNLLYAWGSWKVDPPERIVATVGDRQATVPTSEVAVAGTREVFRSLVEQRTPAILVDEAADLERLIEAWGLEDGKALLDQDLSYEASGEPQVLVDAFPKLRLWDVPSSVKLQPCSSIELLTVTNHGTRSRPVNGYLDGDVLLTTESDPAAVLRVVSDELQLGMTADEIRSILDQLRSRALKESVAGVRAASTLEEKLAILIGGEAMARRLPKAALDAIRGELGREPTEHEIARLVLSVYGVGTLQEFRSHLAEQGHEPPVQWAGGSSTRRWVADLGFPSEFAGFASASRPAMFTVDGPVELPELHGYQKFVVDRIKLLVRDEMPDARGLVSLPTGAGKTRVAVQALVEEVAEGNLGGPIVWIAQSDELCEQAIETWSYIWRAKGPAAPLHVSRLWSTNQVEEVGTGVQLVVATPNKLQNLVDRSEYDWLTENSVVVVDEAHTSVSPMYTEVLAWLGLGRSRKARNKMIGLTATPFRNTSETETRRLAARYDNNRLDEGAFDGHPHEELQRMGVLAHVEQVILSGAQIHLTQQELADTEKFRDIPKSALVKLGANHRRNETIVESVAALPSDWPVLVFAASVDHARVLAALLAFRGISAVSISAETDPAARRHYIEEFKAGRIRVITNYGVLAQGFDAPAVRAVYITRPTYSANLYQQMIGRGLRGPLNGGSERVRIVNVHDNVVQYGERLAFTEFEHLWRKEAADA